MLSINNPERGSHAAQTDYRFEHDSMGQVPVPADKYWGAQTQRCRENFKIGVESMPLELIYALAIVKKGAATANERLGRLDRERCALILRVCDEILSGALDGHFPLTIWQSGSGTQTNMNINEVIANRGNELHGSAILHPNDHVNMSQSTNDAFPSAMHIAAALGVTDKLIPAAEGLAATFRGLEKENEGVLKTGRTHLQDAAPITFAQEIGGWRGMLESCTAMLAASAERLYRLALGGTAVGTGLNAPKEFGAAAAQVIAEMTGKPFKSACNKFHAISSKDELVFAHGAIKALACDLMKIANDVRWLASGPRCGLGEIHIPENEPGSSIMPGKVNPTQCEMATMVSVQVIANDSAIAAAASLGNFQLNAFMPVCIYNFTQSVRLLTGAIHSFDRHCAAGITANREKMLSNLHGSLMTVTALNPHIGYDKAAKAAQKAYNENISIRDAVVSLGFMSGDKFDAVYEPEKMV